MIFSGSRLLSRMSLKRPTCLLRPALDVALVHHLHDSNFLLAISSLSIVQTFSRPTLCMRYRHCISTARPYFRVYAYTPDEGAAATCFPLPFAKMSCPKIERVNITHELSQKNWRTLTTPREI